MKIFPAFTCPHPVRMRACKLFHSFRTDTVLIKGNKMVQLQWHTYMHMKDASLNNVSYQTLKADFKNPPKYFVKICSLSVAPTPKFRCAFSRGNILLYVTYKICIGYISFNVTPL